MDSPSPPLHRPYVRRAGIDPVFERVRAQEHEPLSTHSSDEETVEPFPTLGELLRSRPAPALASVVELDEPDLDVDDYLSSASRASSVPLAADERRYHYHTKQAQHNRWPAGRFFIAEPLVGTLVTMEPVEREENYCEDEDIPYPRTVYVVERLYRTRTKTVTHFDVRPILGPLGEPRRGLVRVNTSPSALYTFHLLLDSAARPYSKKEARAYAHGDLAPPPRGTIRWVLAADRDLRSGTAEFRRQQYRVIVGK